MKNTINKWQLRTVIYRYSYYTEWVKTKGQPFEDRVAALVHYIEVISYEEGAYESAYDEC